MRIRNAAIAGATALAVAFGGTTVAVAQETPGGSNTAQQSSDQNDKSSANNDQSSAKNEQSSANNDKGSAKQENKGSSNKDTTPASSAKTDADKKSETSSKIDAWLQKDKPAQGVALFGSSKGAAAAEEDFKDQPNWAKAFYGLGIASLIATVLGLVVGPIHNFFVHGPSFR
ncbi:hypothetical protein [Corynebacterium lizhenjunii]|uniref:hypothetical protein n=1 Tax=Corynebacterium lizhenjunii TaxID=2709394 RepID=UPI0013EA30A4|nr:hypothetical protein [Corynebacterium lizhenjunii]